MRVSVEVLLPGVQCHARSRGDVAQPPERETLVRVDSAGVSALLVDHGNRLREIEWSDL